MIINTNLSAMTGARLLSESTKALNKSLARLSSGLKIVSPEDDAAGLAVSSRFDAQINRINAVSSNVSNAISFSQTQDGFLKKIAKALDRMSELSVMAQDVTKGAADIALYQTEFAAQSAFINDLATKQFNGIGLLDATDRNVTVDSEGATFTMTGIDGSAYDLSAQDLTTGAAAAQTAEAARRHRMRLAVIGTGSVGLREHERGWARPPDVEVSRCPATARCSGTSPATLSERIGLPSLSRHAACSWIPSPGVRLERLPSPGCGVAQHREYFRLQFRRQLAVFVRPFRARGALSAEAVEGTGRFLEVVAHRPEGAVGAVAPPDRQLAVGVPPAEGGRPGHRRLHVRRFAFPSSGS